MNLGTFVVLVVLIAIVGAIIWSWIKAHREGRHVGCDECGGCSSHNPDSCPHTEDMLKRIEEATKEN